MRAYLGLGANLGDAPARLAWAVAELARQPGVRVVAVSSLYLTAPVGGAAQPEYHNAAVAIETELAPPELLALAQSLERRAGRVRPAPPNAPRPLDIDILLYGEQVVALPDLQIPHPRLSERAFALLPLAEVAPRARHPLSGRTMTELAAAVPAAGARRVADGSEWAASDPR